MAAQLGRIAPAELAAADTLTTAGADGRTTARGDGRRDHGGEHDRRHAAGRGQPEDWDLARDRGRKRVILGLIDLSNLGKRWVYLRLADVLSGGPR